MKLKGLLSAALLLLLVVPVSASAQDSDARTVRTVSVSGEGVHRVAPDMATVRFGVVSRAVESEDARRENESAAREALNAVRALGIDESRIRLENLRLQPWREYNNTERRWDERGFEAARSLVVEIDDLALLPELVARIVQSGANRLDQVSYDLRNRDHARNEALRLALENARGKAQLMTQTLGVELGHVRSIVEQNFDFPRPVFRMQAMEASAYADVAQAEPEAYAAGEIEVRASVQLVYALR